MNLGEAIQQAQLVSVTADGLSPFEVEAIQVLIKEISRAREALQFYANPSSYLDDDAGRWDEDGDFTADAGTTARLALRLEDIPGDVLTPLEVAAIQEERKEAA